MQESIGIAVVECISFGERRILVGLLLYLVADVPEYAAHGQSSLQHEGTAGQISVEMAHIWPPRLFTQERRADASAE